MNFGIRWLPDKNNAYSNLLGLQQERNCWGLRTPDFWDIYDFEVGDVFMYIGNFAAYEGENGRCKSKYTITQKSVHPIGYSYKFESLHWSHINNRGYGHLVCPCEMPFNSGDSIGFFIDSLPYWIFPNNNCNNIKSDSYEAIMHPAFSYQQQSHFQWGNTFYNLTMIDTAANGKLCKTINEDFYNANTDIINQYSSYYNFIPNLGLAVFGYSGFESNMNLELIGYVKNGDTTGTVLSDAQIVSVTEQEIDKQLFEIFPNPSSSGIFTLQWKTPADIPLEIELYDLLGQLLIYKKSLVGETSITIDASEFPDGIYFVRIAKGTQILKCIKYENH